MSEQLLTYANLSAQTQIPEGTLRQLVSRGALPHLRIGPRSVRFDPAAIRAWLASRAVGGRR